MVPLFLAFQGSKINYGKTSKGQNDTPKPNQFISAYFKSLRGNHSTEIIPPKVKIL